MRARPASAVLACLAVLFVAGCAREPLTGLPPDVALIVVDTLRADEMAWAGGEPEAASTLKRLAAEGVAFPRTWAPCPWTKPSTATILTGLHPYRHGVLDHGDKLGEDVVTVAERFAAAGYATAAVVANPSLYDSGYRQGFERFEEVGRWIVHSTGRVGEAARAIVEDSPRDRPLFLYVHFLDPHDMYVPPEGDRLFLPEGHDPSDREVRRGNLRHFEGDIPVRDAPPEDFTPRPIALPDADLAYIRGLYRGEIRAADREIGLLLGAQEAGRGNGLLVAVTSDHGEAFFEHGMYRHGWTLHEEALRVPLVFAGPQVAARGLNGTDAGRAAVSADVVPTLVDLAGLSGLTGPAASASAASTAGTDAFDGASLVRPATEAAGPLHGLTLYNVQQAAWIIEPPYKAILDERFGRHELYDLEADPLETTNLAAERPDVLERLAGRQRALRDELLSRRFESGLLQGEELRQQEEAMRSLGYIQ